MAMIKGANLALAFFIELAALAVFVYWGFAVGENAAFKVALGVGVPVLFVVFWGIFMAPRAPRHLTGTAYLIVKLVLFGLAAVCLAFAAQLMLAIILGVVIVLNTVLLQAWHQGE
jgi:hypothetical protein